jgi:CrcB protein
MMEIISVAVGGALGAVCRYLLGNFISRMSGSALPWGTFAINIIGCFCMGLLMTLIVERGLASVLVRGPVGRLHHLFLVWL